MMWKFSQGRSQDLCPPGTGGDEGSKHSELLSLLTLGTPCSVALLSNNGKHDNELVQPETIALWTTCNSE